MTNLPEKLLNKGILKYHRIKSLGLIDTTTSSGISSSSDALRPAISQLGLFKTSTVYFYKYPFFICNVSCI